MAGQAEELGVGQPQPHGGMKDLVAQSFALRDAAHLAHFQTSSYAAHVALGDFYDGLLPLVDEFVEVYQGFFGIQRDIPTSPRPAGEIVKALTGFSDWVSKNRGALSHGDSSLENILDEIKAHTVRTIYKLRELK